MHKLEADKILEEMAKTFRERNAIYKDNYIALGEVFVALFPDGISLKTKEDYITFNFLLQVVGKLTRFARTGSTHLDSVHDLSVYGAMLEAWLRREEETQ